MLIILCYIVYNESAINYLLLWSKYVIFHNRLPTGIPMSYKL